MAYDITSPLVIGISSRALFDLEAENRIYEEEGLETYIAFQREHENDILEPGTAFQLVKALLSLNRNKREVEVIVMSRNSPDTSLRIFNSLKAWQLDITRAVLTGGAPLAPYLRALKTDLFLSAKAEDVKDAVDHGVAAGQIITGPAHPGVRMDQIRIAFDGDAVLFSADAERVFKQKGIDEFLVSEERNANIPLPEGPFANFLRTIARIQEEYRGKEESPIRTALVTSRNAPAHERPIRTLRQWNVRIDEAFFLGGIDKKDVLEAFGPHIFFDDQEVHTASASSVVAAARVPYRQGDDPLEEK